MPGDGDSSFRTSGARSGFILQSSQNTKILIVCAILESTLSSGWTKVPFESGWHPAGARSMPWRMNFRPARQSEVCSGIVDSPRWPQLYTMHVNLHMAMVLDFKVGFLDDLQFVHVSV